MGKLSDKAKTMKCYFCGGETDEQLVTDLYSAELLYLAVENVPADVCRQCGEKYYDRETTKRLLELTEKTKQHAAVAVPGQRFEVAVCDFNKL